MVEQALSPFVTDCKVKQTRMNEENLLQDRAKMGMHRGFPINVSIAKISSIFDEDPRYIVGFCHF